MVEKILLYSVQSSDDACKTFSSIVHTCSRFKMINKKARKFLPRIHVNLDNDMKKTSFNRKIKLSIRKLSKKYGQNSGLLSRIAELVNDKKWNSAWLILVEDGKSWYTIERIYWKGSINGKSETNEHSNTRSSNSESNFWLKNELYNLKVEDKIILISESAWLNDNIMDAAQVLICKALGVKSYQSVLNCQKQVKYPYTAVDNEHVQLLHDGNNHWLLTFCSSGRIQICDSLKTDLSRVTRKSINSIYRKCVDNSGKMQITFLKVQKQNDGYNCGLFAIAFAAELLNGTSPMDACFDVGKMRSHLINCLESKALTPFPKASQ